ncbi:nucleoside/nucleotide kinase family protein [Mesobacterium pallidum]|uniref:nucleoside/nucleotide kinase family protein n=1 Tax=Mesobacterium pallidum TaxID=2872037 RepID=UPI001EE36E54|nr:nucleoside/nucleotide kinase family protein [Mesobacterium pallidum]
MPQTQHAPRVIDPEALAAQIRALPGTGRQLIAFAGPPGAGKSTLAEDLVARLGPEAAVVPMDGFHLDNVLLDARGLRPRKGAPQTFDAAGISHAIRRLRGEDHVILPAFDRTLDKAIAGVVEIGPAQRLCLVEGNYLLSTDGPWAGLAPLFDLRVALDVPMDVLESRLVQRWLDHGMDPDAARARAEGNDLPNARFVRETMGPVDLVYAPPVTG